MVKATVVILVTLVTLIGGSINANASEKIEQLAIQIQAAQDDSEQVKKLLNSGFDYPIFKTLQLTNNFGLPGFQKLNFPVYKSTGTEGPGILLVHGNSSSARSYVFQVFSLLGAKYKMFLIDLPGLGNSQKVDADRPFPVNPVTGIPVGFAEYTIGMIEAVSVTANDPEINAQILVGWSMGGNVLLATRGFGLLPNAKGFVIFGTAPTGVQTFTTEAPFSEPYIPGLPLATLVSFGFNFKLNPNSPFGFSLDANFTDPVPFYAVSPTSDAPNIGQAYIRAFFNQFQRANGIVPPFFIDDGFGRTDPRHRSSLGATVFFPLPELFLDELQVINSLQGDAGNPSDDVPIAIFAGDEDVFVNNNYLNAVATSGLAPTLWRGSVQIISGAGHAAHFDRPLQFNDLLDQFVNDVIKK